MKEKIFGVVLSIFGVICWFLPFAEWNEVFMGQNMQLFQAGYHMGGISYLFLVGFAIVAVFSWFRQYVLNIIVNAVILALGSLYIFQIGDKISYGIIGIAAISGLLLLMNIVYLVKLKKSAQIGALAAIGILLMLPNISFADPSPLGIQIGSTSASTFLKKFKAKYTGINKYSMGKMYEVSKDNLNMDGIRDALIIFDKDEKAVGVILTGSKNYFDYYNNILKGKYSLVKSNIPFVGDKYAEYKDGNTSISIKAPHMSFDMEIYYIHKSLNDAFERVTKQEEQQKLKNNSNKL